LVCWFDLVGFGLIDLDPAWSVLHHFVHFARFADIKSHPRTTLPFQIPPSEKFESGSGIRRPIPEFLSFGCPFSVVGSRLRIRLWFPYLRDPTTACAQFLTHGRQFGGKNEESGDDGRFPNRQSAQ
jgi:hypothetical protein